MDTNNDITLLKEKLESLVGKKVILNIISRGKTDKIKCTYSCILDQTNDHNIIIKKEVRPHFYIVESFTYNIILCGDITIIPYSTYC